MLNDTKGKSVNQPACPPPPPDCEDPTAIYCDEEGGDEGGGGSEPWYQSELGGSDDEDVAIDNNQYELWRCWWKDYFVNNIKIGRIWLFCSRIA